VIQVAALAVLGLLGLGAVGAALGRRVAGRVLVYGGSCVACATLLVAGAAAMAGAGSGLALPVGLPLTGAHLRLDPLSGFFLFLIGLGGCGASLFAIGYGRHEDEPQRVLPFYPVFLAAMALVVVADDAFTFLFGWELMSVASWALVTAHHREEGNAHAGFVYLVMAAFSGTVLLLTFALLAGGAEGYGFEAIRTAHRGAPVTAVIAVAALIGAGSKAGLVPLHVWLPLAHPAAPSHVSALMSGVMTKVAVYGFVRIAFDLAGGAPWWSALVLLLLGSATAVAGALQAFMASELKRLLAYSTVENIGIVFIALGLAQAFRNNGLQAGAALAMTAGLLHALNHTLFKSLLFFSAGSVLHATGTVALDRLGGLVRAMPWTALAFLAGSAAIAGLPPLNGFVSEWLTFQAVLLRPDIPQWGLKLAVPAGGAMLALTAALAAGCFVRAFAIAFLGRARTPAAAGAREGDAWSVGTSLGFAGLCLAAGIAPGFVIDRLAPVVRALVGQSMPPQLVNAWLTIVPVTEGRSSYNGLLMFVFILVSMLLPAAVLRGRVRRTAPWDCGFPDASPVSQYTAGSFAQPVRRVFGSVLLGARDRVDMPDPGDGRPARLVQAIIDPVWAYAYRPVGIAVGFVARTLDGAQFLSIRRYLGLVFAALVALLLALTLWQ
jgi:hypothetical protein